MPRKPPLSPRKVPQQARAQRTVEALLDATAQVLVAEGWAGTTTNKVAARAGTSIGTLYEYFPSREALATAVIERLAARLLGQTLQTLQQAIADPQEDTARRWFATMVDAIAREAPLVRVIEREIPFARELPMLRRLEQQLLAIASDSVDGITRVTGRRYSPETIYLMATLARAAVLQIATDCPPGLDRERLIDELAAMFVAQFLA